MPKKAMEPRGSDHSEPVGVERSPDTATRHERSADTPQADRAQFDRPHGDRARVDRGTSAEPERVLRQMKQLAWLMDEAVTIPGLNWRVGLDGLIGLIPGIGDIVSAGISGFIIRQASALGVPKVILLRMACNTSIDFVVGSIPLLGDLFDFAWKANRKNLQLTIGYLKNPTRTQRTSWITVVGLLGATIGALLLLALLIVSVIAALF